MTPHETIDQLEQALAVARQHANSQNDALARVTAERDHERRRAADMDVDIVGLQLRIDGLKAEVERLEKLAKKSRGK